MLIRLAAIAILALALPVQAETRVYGPDKDGDAVVLTDDECDLPITAPVRLGKATLTRKDGSTFGGCWAMAIDGVRIQWEENANDTGWRVHPSLFRKVSTL